MSLVCVLLSVLKDFFVHFVITKQEHLNIVVSLFRVQHFISFRLRSFGNGLVSVNSTAGLLHVFSFSHFTCTPPLAGRANATQIAILESACLVVLETWCTVQ